MRLLSPRIDFTFYTIQIEDKRLVILEIDRASHNPDKKLHVPENIIMQQIEKVFQSIVIPEALMEALTEHLKNNHEAEMASHQVAIAELPKWSDMVQTKTRHVAGYVFRTENYSG